MEQFRFSSIHKTESWAIWEAKRKLHSFLSTRCTKEFLEQYLRKHSELLDQISKPELYLDYSPEVRLVIRLHELKLLPEVYRVKFVKSILDYAVEGYDFHVFENKEVENIFTENEFRNLKRKVREKFIPNLSEWRRDRESEFSNYQLPKDYMEPYLESLKLLKKTFTQIKFTSQIDEQIQKIEEWITETEENRDDDISPRKLETAQADKTFKESRSIFDDIDE